MSDPTNPATFTPPDSPMTAADIMASREMLDLMTPAVTPGQQAVDFELPVVGRPEERIRLSGFAGERPVALIFGSYT